MPFLITICILIAGGAIVGTFLRQGYQIRRLQAANAKLAEALYAQNLLTSDEAAEMGFSQFAQPFFTSRTRR